MRTKPTAKTPHQPLSIIIPDSPRIQAALKLASAVEKLAGVIAGDSTHVHITGCHIEGGGTAIHIQKPS